MTRFSLALTLVIIGLSACNSNDKYLASNTKDRTAFTAEVIDLGQKKGPPNGPEGACWQSDSQPAIFETITEQVLTRAATLSPEGKVIKPAVYSSRSKQSMVSERKSIWFQSPCPERISPEFIASLQRALKARGLYDAAITGQWDSPTHSAIGRYQRARGLPSNKLSLIAARELGLISPGWSRPGL